MAENFFIGVFISIGSDNRVLPQIFSKAGERQRQR